MIRKSNQNNKLFIKRHNWNYEPENPLDYMFVVIKDFEEKNWQKYPVHLFKNWTKIEEEKLVKDTI